MGNANQKEALYNAINADDCALTTQIIKVSFYSIDPHILELS